MKTVKEILLKELAHEDYKYLEAQCFIPVIERILEEYANQSRWISVDVEPEFDGRYLCFIEQQQECGNVWEYCQVRDNTINIWTTLANEKITHYQPLPNPPKP
jgi:hypothetical protein